MKIIVTKDYQAMSRCAADLVQACVEKEPQSLADAPLPEEALEELNAASYQGNFGELGELSKKLKENTQE